MSYSNPYKRLFFYPFVVFFSLLSFWAWAQPNPSHPRGIIKREDIPELRRKIRNAPFNTMYDNLLATAKQQEKEQANRPYDPYADSRLLGKQAYLYLLSGDEAWAQAAWISAQRILEDSVYYNDRLSRGLTRALLLQKMAIAYDFCYAAWNEGQRKQMNDQLYEVMYSVNANMGHTANYAIESNWMGVRYGSVLLASYVWDPPLDQDGKQSAEQPLRWDAFKRLQEHLDKTLFVNGWNGESMSYHIYGWTFIGPALLAMKNNLNSFDLAEFAPESINTLHGIMTSTVAIKQKGTKGIQADLSDDDLMFGTEGVLGMAFQLYPVAQLPALKWMHNYLIEPKEYPANSDGHLFYSILYYPDKVAAQNPAELNWLTYHDPEQGIVIIRNRFQDKNDIVSTYNAKATRIKGHAGPDANTFRLIGLGVPWIIGGGRTALTAGQSNLFPAPEETAEKDSKGLGTLHDFRFYEDSPDAYALGSGSSVGTENHQRLHYTSFSKQTQAAAVVVVGDNSANGQRWRINTPEFNIFSEIRNGYQLTAPNGATLQLRFLEPKGTLQIQSGLLPYGGNTLQHNSGIWYEDQPYTYSRFVDVSCEGEATVVITLQPKGKPHPDIERISHHQLIVGDKEINLPGFEPISE